MRVSRTLRQNWDVPKRWTRWIFLCWTVRTSGEDKYLNKATAEFGDKKSLKNVNLTR